MAVRLLVALVVGTCELAVDVGAALVTADIGALIGALVVPGAGPKLHAVSNAPAPNTVSETPMVRSTVIALSTLILSVEVEIWTIFTRLDAFVRRWLLRVR